MEMTSFLHPAGTGGLERLVRFVDLRVSFSSPISHPFGNGSEIGCHWS
jgi:hypothetical protein